MRINSHLNKFLILFFAIFSFPLFAHVGFAALTVNASVSSTSVTFGQNVTLIGRITNDTVIDRVWANISYTNINNGQRVSTSEEVNLTFSYNETNEYIYEYNYTPPRSGNYNVNITVNATSESGSNTTSFDVSFGQGQIEFTFPYYRILNNQTFNITVNVIASDGDLWSTNLTLNISDQTKMNITGTDWSDTSQYNISSGTSQVVRWETQSKQVGSLISVSVNATPQNGTGNETSTLFAIITPDLTATPSIINITDNTTFRVEVMGNVTPISAVNFTVDKPYLDDFDYVSSETPQVLNESDCVDLGVGTGENVALDTTGGSATCFPGTDCNDAIDGSTVTKWDGTEDFWLNVTLDNTYVIDKVEINWDGIPPYSGNVSIYYNNTTDSTWVLFDTFSVENFDSNKLRTYTAPENFTTFSSNSMLIKNSTADSGISIKEFRIYSFNERVDNCYVYEFNYTNITRSGNYTFNSTVRTQTNVTKESSFWVNFGDPIVTIDKRDMINNTNRNFSTIVEASNGDLRNLTVNLTIYNQDIINITSGQTFEQNIPEILNGQNKNVSWNITALDVGSTNITSHVNSTTGKTRNYSYSRNYTVTVFKEDKYSPNVTGFWFKHLGNNVTKTNLYTNLTIYANVSDDTDFETIIVNITSPTSSINGTMVELIKNETWKYTFGGDNLNLSKTGNYTVRIIAEDIAGKVNVSGKDTFYVTDNLTLEASINPPTPEVNSNFNLSINISDVNGNLHQFPVDLTITCLNVSQKETNFSVTNVNGNTTFTHCYAINLAGKNFDITINATDQYNNTNSSTFSFTTESAPSGGGTTESGGPGGGGGVAPSAPVCEPEADYETNCTDELDNDCDGATDCADPDCFEFKACIKKIPDFIFNVTPQVEILQGEDGKIGGTLKNIGNIQLLLKSSVDIEKDCCSVDINPSFIVPQKTTRGFNATIHVNTSTPPGEYLLTFNLRYYNLQNSQTVKVIVKENEIISYIFKTMTGELPRIISEINEYKDVGVDVSHLEDRIDNIQNLIQDAKLAVDQDNLELLKRYNNEIRSDIEFIQAEKSRLAFQKLVYENKWNITYGIIAGMILTYMITRVLYPFVRLSHEIVNISFEVKTLKGSVKQAQKQYFMRKIDEDTFRRIISGKHDQVLKLISQINLKKQQRMDLLKKRLNPLSLGEYVKKKLSKNILSR